MRRALLILLLAFGCVGEPALAQRGLNNFTATTDPTPVDDSTLLYRPGSRWLNVVSANEFACVSAGIGVAVWKRTTIAADAWPEGVLIGRGVGAGTGPAQAVTVGSGLAIGGTTVSSTGGSPATKLAADITCAVSTSYCTIWSYVPPTASTGVNLYARILINPASTTVAPQFRVSSADAGYTGTCYWTLYDKASGTTTAPAYVTRAIGTAPADTASTAWGIPSETMVEVRCALLADASPGAIVIEFQLETGVSPTSTVRQGSKLEVTQN